jgi:hypothetical protein
LADAARVTIEQCEAALHTLSAPDEFSRSTDFNGRRIEPCSGGWLLLNGEAYRKKMNADDRREYKKMWARKQVLDSSLDKTRHSETEIDTLDTVRVLESESASNTKKEKKKSTVLDKPKTDAIPVLDFLDAIKANPAYKDIAVDREVHKMQAWLLTPKGKRRKLTAQFVVNWLNKVDVPIEVVKTIRVYGGEEDEV